MNYAERVKSQRGRNKKREIFIQFIHFFLGKDPRPNSTWACLPSFGLFQNNPYQKLSIYFRVTSFSSAYDGMTYRTGCMSEYVYS